jgi:hypothetical protein
MTRFEEICDSYQKLISGAEQYENECRDFAQQLVNGFIDYLECGRNDLEIKQFAINEDGYFHCTLELTVYQGNDKYASRGLVPEITLKIGRDVDDFIVKLTPGTQVYGINRYELNGNNESLNKIYEAMYRGIKSYYETPIDEFIHKNMKGAINFG